MVSFLAMGLQGLYAPYVERNLGGGAALYGLYNACFAVGSIVGGVVSGYAGKRVRAGPLILVGLTGQAVMITLLGVTHQWWVALSLAIIGGVAQETNNVPWRAFTQARVPQHAYGRVSTLIGTVINFPTPIAVVATSLLATNVSIGTTYTAYGLLMFLCIGASAVSTPEIWRLRVGDVPVDPRG